MLAYSVETYDESTHRRLILDGPETATSGQGMVAEISDARHRSRTSAGSLEPENRAVALRRMALTAAAATAMESILADSSIPVQAGQALPAVSAEELLRRLGH